MKQVNVSGRETCNSNTTIKAASFLETRVFVTGIKGHWPGDPRSQPAVTSREFALRLSVDPGEEEPSLRDQMAPLQGTQFIPISRGKDSQGAAVIRKIFP